jgi:hypothetical protein
MIEHLAVVVKMLSLLHCDIGVSGDTERDDGGVSMELGYS